MQTFAWIELMRIVPPQLHANLFVVLDGAAEVNLQNIFRMEREYMVVRGRMSGTNEGTRIMFLPFDRIVYLGFRSEMKDQDIQAMYGGTPTQMPIPQAVTPAPMTTAEVEPAPTIPSMEPIQPAPVAAGSPTSSPRPSGPQPLPGKAALLERLRKSRLGQDAGRPSSST